jgi:hypothetical protein
MQQETTFSPNHNFPKKFNLVPALKRKHKSVGQYFEIQLGKKKPSWRKAKVWKIKGDDVTFSYYVGETISYKSFKKNSKNIRKFSRECFKIGDVIDVKYAKRWHPAEILSIDKKTGLHSIRYEKKKGWDGLYFYEDIRIRPSAK